MNVWSISVYLQVVTCLLAVCDSLDLSWRGHVHGLTHVREAKGPGNAHVCQWQVIHIQQRPQTWQTMVQRHVALCEWIWIVREMKAKCQQKTIPQSHDVAIGTETGDAVSSCQLHNVGSQDERGLCDVVFVNAGLGRQGHYFGLFLWAKHSKLAVLTLLWCRGRGWPAPPALLFLLIWRVWVIPWLVGRGQQSSSGIQESHG